MKNIPTLAIIILLTLLSCIQLQEGSDGTRCIGWDKDGDCICCKSGYRGNNCSTMCKQCLSRHDQGQLCKYYCQTGYYGKTCEKECPGTCGAGVKGPRFCEEENGFPVCATCIQGYHGRACGQLCGKNCLNKTCYQIGGKCLNCSSITKYGDLCNIKCNSGCVSETCNMTGHCIEGCKYGFYGDKCETKCGENCMDGNCTRHDQHEFKCTGGCLAGYMGIQCFEKCQHPCMKCGQHSGICTSCLEDYAINHETKECVKHGSTTTLWIIAISVVLVGVVVGVVIFVLYRKMKRKTQDHGVSNAEELGLLSPTGDLKNKTTEYSNGTGGGEGVRKEDLVDLQIDAMQDTFVETSIYNLVEAKLKNNGYVTISGASGEGKTSMALMLGNEYKQKGYQLVFVTDPIKFNMEIVTGRKTFCIFDDIFGADRLTDTSKLKEVLLYVQLNLKKAKEMNNQTETIKDIESATRQLKDELNFMVVFTSKTYNLTGGMLKIPECKQFMNSSVVDVTVDAEYNQSDMEQIFEKHKQKQNVEENMPVKDICNLRMLTFGFPLLCKMYFQLLYSKGIDVLEFFREPVAFLESEITSIIESKNAKSAALILMMLCEDGLNCFHLDNDSDDTVLDKKVKQILNLMNSLNRSHIAQAAKQFQGTYFTKGDTMYFSHPAITYACAFVIFDIYPTFLLKNGSMKFIYERIHPVLSDLTMIDRKKNTILISPDNSDIIVERLAEDVKKGQYNMSISHPILRNKDVVEKLFTQLQPPLIYFHKKYNEKCFLHWAVRAKSLYLIQKILGIEMNFSPEEIQQACEACVTCGNTLILKFLLEKLGSTITDTVVINVALAVAYTENSEMFECLLLNEQNLNLALSLTSQGHNMLHAACIGGSKKIVERVSQWINIDSQDQDGQTAIMLAVLGGKYDVVSFLTKKGADLTRKDTNGDTVFDLACQVGNSSIVEHLLPLCDINSPGQNGWTPVMNAAYSGKNEIFDMLVTKGADLALTDDYGNTVFHYACWGGNTSIVEQLLPLFDINSRGQYGWTPVIIAANSGKKEVFDLLVTKRADLTLTGSDNYNILHQACTGGNIDIVRYTLPLYDVNVLGWNSHTPLMRAVLGGHIDVVDLLLSNEADVKLVGDDGGSLLHLACEDGNLAMVKHVLPYCDINLKDKFGWTPLLLAVFNGEFHIFQFLESKGASLEVVDSAGDDVLTLAYQGGCEEIVQQLTPCGEEIQRIEKWTLLMYYVAFGHWTLLKESQQESPELVQRDGFGNTLLHLACRGGNLQCVEYLLPSYDINVRGRYRWTPVMMAARCGHMDVLQCLISHKSDLSLVSDTGEDVLSLARRGTHADIVTFLLTLPDFSDTG